MADHQQHEHESSSSSETTPLLARSPPELPASTRRVIHRSATGQGQGSGQDSSASTAVNGNGTQSTDNANDNGNDDDEENNDKNRIPGWQVFWLCLARLVEPLAYFSIFPYISQMVQDLGHLAEADVGFYAGLIESLFSLTQAAMMIPWGRLSDRAGRRPVLVVSLTGVVIATSTFGFARSISQMILFRCVAGLFAGTIVTIRTMLAELSNPHTQARVFSYFALAGNLGIFLGPLLGGALADPASQYGGWFEDVWFFNEFRYALASLVVGAVGVVATVTVTCFVKETLPKKENSRADEEGQALLAQQQQQPEPGTAKNGVITNGSSAAALPSSTARPASPMTEVENESVWKLLQEPGVGIVMFNYGYLGLLATGYTAIVPVWWFTPVELGGFGFSPLQISLVIAINGIAQALWLLLVFPPLQRRIGTNGVMRICGAAYPWFFAVAPGANWLLRHGHDTIFWSTFPPALSIACGVSMAFTASTLSVNEVSPSHRVLGTLNAISLMLGAGVRAFAPGLFSSLYAVGANTQLLGGYAIWLLMFVLAIGFAVSSRYMPDYAALKKKRDEEAAAAAAAAQAAAA